MYAAAADGHTTIAAATTTRAVALGFLCKSCHIPLSYVQYNVSYQDSSYYMETSEQVYTSTELRRG